jgi:hypothetical protein
MNQERESFPLMELKLGCWLKENGTFGEWERIQIPLKYAGSQVVGYYDRMLKLYGRL